MIKLVASDLDGTLLHNYQQTVPKEIYDTIKALHEKGIIFTAASGRQYANIRRLFAPLGFDIPYIAENGSMCVYKEEILATGLTPSKTIRHILDALMEYRKIYHTGHCILSVKDTYYSDSTDERFIDYMENDMHNIVTYVPDQTKPLHLATPKNRSSKQPSVILVAQRIWNPSSTKGLGMKSAL